MDSITALMEDMRRFKRNKVTSADLLPHAMAFSRELFSSNGRFKELHIIDLFLFFCGGLELFLDYSWFLTSLA